MATLSAATYAANPLYLQPGETPAAYETRTATLQSGAPATLTPTQANPSAPVTSTQGLSGDALDNYLENEFNTGSTASTIMQSYQAAQAANVAGAGAAGQQIADQGQQNIEGQNYLGSLGLQTGITNSKGLVNPGAMTVIQNQSNTIVKQLTQQMNDALANNQAQLASTNANLIAQENTNMITARQNFLTNYFSSQSEARSEASFQTPAQQEVLTMAGTYPGAGITPDMTLEQAESAVQSSPQYQQQLATSAANIRAALASAGASSASAGLSGSQAQQTQTITNLINGTGDLYNFYVGQLVKNGQNPATGMSEADIESAISSLPGGSSAGVMTKILSGATSQGYNSAGAGLGNLGAQTNTRSLTSGGFSTFGTGLTNLGGSFLQGAGGLNTPSLTQTPPSNGTDGASYGYPGYSYSSQYNAWIPKQ